MDMQEAVGVHGQLSFRATACKLPVQAYERRYKVT